MIKAKKEFGQNFLQDGYFVNQIIESMPKSTRLLVEIGPGLGDLTKEILKIRSVLAIEIDRDLYKILLSSFNLELASKRLVLINADVLDYWDNKVNLADEPYDLVANLPYYVATEIILRALKDPNCKNLLVMVQKEVADRFVALPRSSDYSSLAIIARSVGSAKIEFVVPPEAFNPAPKVDSAVISFAKDRESYDEDFAKFLKKAFVQPRKTLQKNLAGYFDKELIRDALKKLNILENSRAHELDYEKFLELYMYTKGIPNGKQQ